MPEMEQRVEIKECRQCSGGVYPRLSFAGDEPRVGTSPAPTNECSGEVYPRLVGLGVS